MSTPTATPRKIKRLEGVEYLPISEIKVNRDERLRKDPEEIAKNAIEIRDSLLLVGPINPILLTENNELIAGECRLEAYKLLGQTEVPITRRQKLERAMQLMIELDENMRRQKMCWQDIALGIDAVHHQESAMAAKRKEEWSLRATGHLVKASHSYVQDCLIVTRLLKQKDKEIWDAKSLDQAKQIILLRTEQAAMAAKAKLSGALLTVPQPAKATKPSGIISIQLGTNQPAPSVITASPAEIREMRMIKLSDRVFNMDCVDLMNNVLAPNSVDFVATDIPYGIDMALLEDMHGIEQMKSTHQVDQNVEQMKPFLQGAYRVLKDNTYLMFFFAQQHQEKLATWGREVGFSVLDWNLLWLKPHSCKNQAAHINPTKSYEPVMVMKKGSPRLTKPMPLCHMTVDGMPDKKLQSNPFAKPLEFVDKMMLEPVFFPGMTVLDPFAGGGSIVRAAILKGCKIIACEIDEARYPELQNRIKDTYKNMLGGNVQFL
jgi:DNA modification methylase/ParB-like chromosome segregation protein Spo0J